MRIALVSTYSHLTRDSIERMLRAAFPEYAVDILSISDIVKQQRGWILPNLWHVGTEYGHKLVHEEMTLREAYFRTTYTFTRLHRAMRRVIDPKRHRFSFQMQSMYNTAVPGVPHFVYTDHTHLSNLNYADFDRSTLRSPRWIALERTIYHDATVVFTRSTDVAADLVRYYGLPADRVECVYAGSNVNSAMPDPPVNDNYSNQNIIFVGVDWERKGGPELLQAFRSVRESFPSARLTLIGPPDLSVDLPNVTVLGNVSPERLAESYSQASIFCLPTKREPFGIAFVEAMTHQLPIVGTRVGAVPDMVEEGVNGYLVEPGRPDELAKALCRLLSSPAVCREFGQRSFERATRLYNWENTGERIRARILHCLGPQAIAV